MEMEKMYVVPVVEVLEVEVEKGFSASDVVNPPFGDPEGM